jgi:Tfp pilus assembly protein PilF
MLCLAACASSAPSSRALHEVDGELVYSRPVSPAAYAAYLRARLAIEQDPPDLEGAREQIDVALRYDPNEPHLWTTRAEIDERRGAPEEARMAVERALELRPGYAPARALMARLGRSDTALRAD